MSDLSALSIKPVIHYPRIAQVGKTYVMTVDLQPDENFEWNYEQEEYPIHCVVDSDCFKCRPVGSSVVVLHRFGGNYGSVKFCLTAFQEVEEGYIEVILVSAWGINIRTLKLHPIQILSQDTSYIQSNILASEELVDTVNSRPTYLESLEVESQEAFQPLNAAKLIFVGFGGVGKTSLISSLTSRRFSPKSSKTEGIGISHWPIQLHDDERKTTEDVMLHVWDFGGQEIMHSTHQFFLTEHSLYILVLSGRQGREDSDAEYWLELIQSFGANSPVIVVLNKTMEFPFDVNRINLQRKFPNIKSFIQTDCATQQGIEQLQAIIKQQVDQLENLRFPFPNSWIAIKDEITNSAKSHISFEKYREICQRNGEEDITAQDSLAVHLHNLGIILNYNDDPRLHDTSVLNPHWITRGVYTILNSYKLMNSQGELIVTDLLDILDSFEYPPECHNFLMQIMQKFELCIRFEEDEDRYLFPNLLDKQSPPEVLNFHLEQCLNFRYEYHFIPAGLLSRFIVRTHVLSKQSPRWRTGVILSFEGNRALIQAKIRERYIAISVDGSASTRRRLLTIIRSDFERVHDSFKFRPKELVPIPKHPSVTVEYQELLLREKGGKATFETVIDGELVDLSVQKLLSGVDVARLQTSERSADALNLFYIYAHKDERLREELELHLKILERQGLIKPWHDRRIVPGEDWTIEPDENLIRADIILLLISADFIASDYCYEREMREAMNRHERGEATVIPIALRLADWEGTPFAELQGLPSDSKPVTQWRERDAAWLDVENGIENAIHSMRAGPQDLSMQDDYPHTLEKGKQKDALRLFCVYSHRDEYLHDEFETHLKILERQGLIKPWHDRRIIPGEDWTIELDDNLIRADIIILLISADFIASDYCYEREMMEAIDRHERGEAIVIPIALRPTNWGRTAFSELQGLPSDSKPVTQWSDRDAAWLNVENGIRDILSSVSA